MTARLSPSDLAPLRSPDDTRTWITFSGTYEFEGKTYLWQCTSTNIVYELRKKEHWKPLQETPNDKTVWIKITQDSYALVDKSYFSNPVVKEMTNGNKAI